MTWSKAIAKIERAKSEEALDVLIIYHRKWQTTSSHTKAESIRLRSDVMLPSEVSSPRSIRKEAYMFDYSNLLGAMATKGITRQDLAEKIGLSRTYFCTILKQGKPMTSDVVYRIAEVLGLEDLRSYFFTLNVAKH